MAMDLSLARGKWEEVKKNLPQLIASYEDDITAAEQRLSIRGKTGPEAQKEQCAWPAYYGMKKAELTKLLKYLNARVDDVRGELTRRYIERSSRELPERAREKYIDNEVEYIRMYELYLEVEELRDKYAAICDAFDRRGFALRDWTQLKINELTDVTI